MSNQIHTDIHDRFKAVDTEREIHAIMNAVIRSDQNEAVIVWSKPNRFYEGGREYITHRYIWNDDQFDINSGHYCFDNLEAAMEDGKKR